LEKLLLGFRVILAGNGEAPGALLPPHAGKNKNKKMVTTTHTPAPKRKLPMHPLVASRLQPVASHSMEWKTFSVEAGDGFSKQRPRNPPTPVCVTLRKSGCQCLGLGKLIT